MLKFIFIIITIIFLLLNMLTLYPQSEPVPSPIVFETTASATLLAATLPPTDTPAPPTVSPVVSIETPTMAATSTPLPTATATSTLMPLPQSQFVTVSEGKFMLAGRPHYFAGANFWQGMHLGANNSTGNRARLMVELDQLQQLGLTNLRVMASSEGPETEPYRLAPALMPAPGEYNESLFDGLDFLLLEMGKRNMKAVMVLTNYWHWSGGMAQYVSWHEKTAIPYDDWPAFMDYSARFYTCKQCQIWYRNHIETVVNRENPYTGLKYRDDPTIFAWELANEPRRYPVDWINSTATFIKSLDPDHLVTTGSEGAPPGESQNFIETHRSPDIDYATVHVWPQNWGWYDPANPASYTEAEAKARDYVQTHAAAAALLGKPFVLEEFGLARDWEPHRDIYNFNSPITYRDAFYAAMFEEVYHAATNNDLAGGDNFWVWAGPAQPNDNWSGDPPHETAGWYSVYATDESTTAIIAAHAKVMNSLP